VTVHMEPLELEPPESPGSSGTLEPEGPAVLGSPSVLAVPAPQDLDDASREQATRRLFELVRTSTSTAEAATARDQIVRLHMEVARSLARRYRNRGIADEDLEQVAYLTLVKVVRTFDLEKGQSFMAFAVPSIRGALKKHFRDRGWVVRPPRRIQEMQYAIRRATEELQQALGRSPRPSEVAAHLSSTVDDVVEALAADSCFSPASLDRPTTPGGDQGSAVTLGDCIGFSEDALEAAEARAVLGPAVRRLCRRDRRIVELRFFEQRSQQEIAEDIGVTQMQVSRLLARILRDLRETLTTPDEPEPERVPQPPGQRTASPRSAERSTHPMAKRSAR
jgi:RNA polymerase sigma-B factor